MTETEELEQLLEEELVGCIAVTPRINGLISRVAVDLSTDPRGIVILFIENTRVEAHFEGFKDYLKVYHGHNERPY